VPRGAILAYPEEIPFQGIGVDHIKDVEIPNLLLLTKLAKQGILHRSYKANA
jgi:hypothetical protein